jgi:G3E family GTPase
VRPPADAPSADAPSAAAPADAAAASPEAAFETAPRAEAGDPVPVLVLTGALGSGKTTLLRGLLEAPGMEDTALVINEFGAVGLDHLLVASAVESTLLLENGCVCCALRGDLVDTLADLLDRRAAGTLPPFRRIVVETSGVADPVPIVRELAGARNLLGRARLVRIVTAVDAALGLSAPGDAGASQILQADTLVITKADRATPIAVDRLAERLAGLNPAAGILVARGGRLPDPPALFARDALPARPALAPAGHRHVDVASWSVRLDRPLPWPLWRDWLDLLYSLRPAQLVRMKGLLWVVERARPVLVQGVGPLVAPPELMPSWPEGRAETRLVVIARDLDPGAIAASFAAEVEGRAPAGAGA